MCHAGGGVPAQDAGDDDSDDDDDSTVRSRVDGSPSLKRTELQTYDSSASSNAGPLAGGLAIPSAAAKPDDPGQWPALPCPVLPLPANLCCSTHQWMTVSERVVLFTSAAAKPDDPGLWPALPCPALPCPALALPANLCCSTHRWNDSKCTGWSLQR